MGRPAEILAVCSVSVTQGVFGTEVEAGSDWPLTGAVGLAAHLSLQLRVVGGRVRVCSGVGSEMAASPVSLLLANEVLEPAPDLSLSADSSMASEVTWISVMRVTPFEVIVVKGFSMTEPGSELFSNACRARRSLQILPPVLA